MNAAERHKAKVEIRNLELECRYYEAYVLANESAAKCWKMCDNYNHAIFEKLADRIFIRMVSAQE